MWCPCPCVMAGGSRNGRRAALVAVPSVDATQFIPALSSSIHDSWTSPSLIAYSIWHLTFWPPSLLVDNAHWVFHDTATLLTEIVVAGRLVKFSSKPAYLNKLNVIEEGKLRQSDSGEAPVTAPNPVISCTCLLWNIWARIRQSADPNDKS